MDDISAKIIDLRARISRLPSPTIAEDAAAAIAELEALRTSLRNLNIIMQLQHLAGIPLADQAEIHRILSEIAEELTERGRVLRLSVSERPHQALTNPDDDLNKLV